MAPAKRAKVRVWFLMCLEVVVQRPRVGGCILKANPNQADALNLKGILAASQGEHATAATCFKRLIKLNPNDTAARINYGNVLRELGHLDQARASYSHALKRNGRLPDAYLNRGLTLHRMERREEALADFDRALALNANDPEAWNNRGAVLDEWRRYGDAIASFQKALQIRPDFADAYVNLGNTLSKLNRKDEAFECYSKAAEMQPHAAAAQIGMGSILDDLNRSDLSLSYYEKALQLEPRSALILSRAGRALSVNKRPSKALAHLEKATKLAPKLPNTLGAYLHVKMQLSDWRSLAPAVKQLERNIREGIAEAPINVLELLDDLELQKLAAQASAPPATSSSDIRWPLSLQGGERIRIAYFSPDFRNHAVSFLAAELFEVHDRSSFEVFGFWFGPETSDDMQKRLSAAFDHFIDIRDKSDQEVAAMCKELNIAIAIDLAGHTHYARLGLFHDRCAPIQVIYLGYAGTTGVSNMDYIIADEVVIRPWEECYFTEKPVYLPVSFQVNDSKRAIAEKTPSREEQGLPETAFVFCCFNRASKITPEVFACWMRILNRVNEAVLWLATTDPVQQSNLRRSAKSQGIAPHRLIFANHTRLLAQHLARHRIADLFLDTCPYTAHTTASDALWAGLPLITCKGQSFVSRVSASLLTALGLKELITDSLADYEALAIHLATDAAALKRVKERLAHGRAYSPLFKASEFVRGLEQAYREMIRRAEAGLPPASLQIKTEGVLGGQHDDDIAEL